MFVSLQSSREPLLDIDTLNCFYGNAQVLFDVSIKVHPGEAVALIGRNGAGKTTLLHAIAGLVPLRAQCLSFHQHSLLGLAPHRIAQLGIGLVPEGRRIFSTLTVAENLEVGNRSNAKEKTLERILALFPTLRPLLSRRGDRLSGGEQQMLAIARTLMGHPRLLLLDEPAEGLAPLIVEQTITAINNIKAEGTAILLADQNPVFAHHVTDRAYVIERGTVHPQ